MDNTQDARVNKQREIKEMVPTLSASNVKNLNRFSSREQKKEFSDVIYDKLSEYLFDKTVFISLLYSDFGDNGVYGGTKGTTSTTNYATSSRIIDTSEGMLMSPGKESRLRCNFSFKNPSVLDGYILSPAVLDSQTLGSITSLVSLRSYVGLKIYKSVIYIVVKQAGREEVTYPLDFEIEMSTATFSRTYALEIIHNINTTDIIINGQNYGTFSTDLVGTFSSVETFYPFFSVGKSTDGTIVNIAVENIQFIQNKQ